MIRTTQIPSSRKKNTDIKTIGVLTSGGDAPGMNAAVRAVTRYSISQGCRVQAILHGYQGVLEGQFVELKLHSVANILQRGGTMIKTARCKEFHEKEVRKKAADLLKKMGIDALVAIGGDGTFAGAHLLHQETGFPVIGVPGTIDNDIPGTESTIGFDTAVNTAIDAIDRIRDTASSHDRTFLVEVMGRASGLIALQVGIGGGAETVLVPEIKNTPESVCKTIQRGMKRGKMSSIIVVAEGGITGTTHELAAALKNLGYSNRVCILGHIQRGGRPTARDRLIASVLGASAVEHILHGYNDVMMGVRDNQVTAVPFTEVFGKKKSLSEELLQLAQTLAT